MRLEKGYRHWKADLIYENNPIELGLERFVNLDKADFVGKAALLKEIEQGAKKHFVCMQVCCEIAAAQAGDSVYSDDKLIGTVTSGGYGHRVEKNIAYALVDPKYSAQGTELDIGILGERYAARVCPACLYDEENLRVREPD